MAAPFAKMLCGLLPRPEIDDETYGRETEPALYETVEEAEAAMRRRDLPRA